MLSAKLQTAAIALFVRSFFIAVFCFALTLSSASAYAGEVEPFELKPSRDTTTDFVKQMDGLEKTLDEATAVSVVETQKQNSGILAAARVASEKEVTDKPVAMPSYPESRPVSSAWASVVPQKDSRVGEQASNGSAGNSGNSAEVNNLTAKPSTSTLSLSDMGNAKSVMNTLAGMDGIRKSPDKAGLPNLNGVLALNQPKPGTKEKEKKAPEKKDDSGSKVDPNNTSSMSKFGDTGDLSFKNISKNNKNDSNSNDDLKNMIDKALGNKDKNKDAEEQKKKEEQAKLEKKLDELVKKDPFKYEDYEALRDLYNEKGKSTEDLLANNPKFKDLKEKILSDFAPRDASPESKKAKLIDFLSSNDGGEKFQTLINVADPNAARHLESPTHLGE